MRERKDVYKLPAGDRTLEWYAKGVEALQALPPTDPRSWHSQAAIHGINPLPAAMKGWWAECQHGSSFFLPWHRMYILHFERIIAEEVAKLGGPADWALPYWNYTPSDPRTLKLPSVFRSPTNAAGGRNPLYVAARNPVANSGGAVLGPRDVDLRTCLGAPGNTVPGGFFGGSPSAHFGHLTGALELTPHNAVHRQVGAIAGGWMADPDLAALDPIFWLHHANIDRLWEVWLACDPTHANLTTPYWLTGVAFNFHDASGKAVSMRSQDVLNLAAPSLDYKYTDTTCPFAVVGPPGRLMITNVGGGPRGAVPNQPELVGATLSSVALSDQTTHVLVPTPVTPHAFRLATNPSAAPGPARALVDRVTLHLENVTSTDVAPTYDLFLGVPENEDPSAHGDRFVARVAMFGIAQASDPQGVHGGGGQNFAFDITDLYHRLSDANEIDAQNLRVAFVPVSPVGAPRASVGRISVYFE